ncbi:MAG TPA: hypothetical protein VMH80_05615 [Bryobacteraceae bacterium]|nr:hypothetical protein [Bryobacteraceae bacterium]
MIFDGAWRLLQGQVPYRDVLYPFGPVTFVVQALFFMVFGVNFSATVLSAAVLNAVAGLLVMRIVYRLLPDARAIAFLAGIATICWFQAPFGTLWFEQTAFFFGLVALFVALEAEFLVGSRVYWLHACAGVLMVVSVLSKQNAGVLFIPAVAGVAVVPHLHPRALRTALLRLAAQLSGFSIASAAFFAWLWLFSEPRQFFHYSIEITRRLADQRTPVNPTVFITGFFTFGAYPLSLKLSALFLALIGLGALLAGVLRWPQSPEQSKTYALAGWITLSCLVFQELFIFATVNEAENGLPFIGLASGLSLGILAGVLGREGARWSLSSGTKHLHAVVSGRACRALLIAILVLVWVPMILQGARVSWKRFVQEYTSQSRFGGMLDVDGLRRVKWADFSYADRLELVEPGHSTSAGEWWLRKSDFEGVNNWLAQHRGNFFVFGDATMLYGLHHSISPQPWLYFLADHSYLREDVAGVDEIVTASLSRKSIRTVIIEKVSWAGGQDAEWLTHMPRLKAWIEDNFVKEKEYGIYEVWVAKQQS